MGMAARQGDMTTHGGAIVKGALRTMIGKMPAARVGDMHSCPLVTPGTPPVPHVGGPISKGSTGVFIEGMPAARAGDMAPCVGPPDSIAGGCPTVNIGEKGGAGGGDGGSSGGGNAAAAGAIASAQYAAYTPQPDTIENHFIELSFKDSAGLPVDAPDYLLKYPDGTTTGGVLPPKLKQVGVQEGQYEITVKAITSARWSKNTARDDETVTCIVETSGIEDGTEAVLQIWVRNVNNPDRVVVTVEGLTVQDGGLEYEWEPWFYSESEVVGEGSGFQAASFFFTVSIKDINSKSGLLIYKDYLELLLVNDENKPLAKENYTITLPTGEILKGSTKKDGTARHDGIPPGSYTVSFESETK